MARPTKQGVDYFPLDVYLDDKFKFIQIKYKLEGFAILIKLFQKVYSYGYWYMWTEDEALIFADENKAELEIVDNVIKEAIKRDIFDKELFDKYNILTSKGIQKRYKEMVRRRKDVEVVTEYLLIDNDFGVNDDIKPTPSIHDDDKSTQSKLNKTKEDKSIVDESKNIILTSYEAAYIKLLGDIEGYPLDRKKDLEYMKQLEERYPTLDLVEAINKFSTYVMDKPFKNNANHRSQLNTSFGKYVEWGNCLKAISTSSKKYKEDNPFINRS